MAFPFSISTDATFTEIDWSNYKNRPVINETMPLCTDQNWDEDVPCCMPSYLIKDTTWELEESATTPRN